MFGDNLKKLRKEKGLSQTDVAKKLYVTRQCVSKWEKGVTQPDLQTLSKLGELLSASVDELINGEPVPKKSSNPNVAFIKANIFFAVYFVTFFIVLWRFMPRTIPAHWSGSGIDRYGSRNEIFFNLITVAVFSVLDIVLYKILKRVEDKRVIWIAHSVILFFQIINFIFIFAMYGKYIEGVIPFVACLSAALIMCISAASHPKISGQNFLLGVRTKETLSSPEVWRRANTLSCFLNTFLSFILLAMIMIWKFEFSYLFLTAYIIPAIAVCVYAKIIYKRASKNSPNI